MGTVFQAKERQILKIVQDNLPDSATPYQDIADTVGSTEQEVLELLAALKAKKAIRRFGATLRHQKAGYSFNAMVAWYVEDDQDMGQIGRTMARLTEISHCYERRACLDWPYNLYTMIHGKAKGECQRIVEQLSRELALPQYVIFYSEKELKKTSMRYF